MWAVSIPAMVAAAERRALKPCQVGPAFVDHDPVWHAIHAYRPLEEPPGGGQITPLGQHEPKVREAKSRVFPFARQRAAC
jgi:hypothetical protein